MNPVPSLVEQYDDNHKLQMTIINANMGFHCNYFVQNKSSMSHNANLVESECMGVRKRRGWQSIISFSRGNCKNRNDEDMIIVGINALVYSISTKRFKYGGGWSWQMDQVNMHKLAETVGGSCLIEF